MAKHARFRDSIGDYIPVWLRERPGFTVAYRYLWTFPAMLDAAVEVMLQGIQAAWPGKGTPTALPWIGRTRGILRGQADTQEEFAAKLRAWLDTWRDAGSMEVLARQIRGYLGNHPRVRIVNRAGQWFTVNEDGSEERHQAAWNWDGVSHPKRSDPNHPWWSDLWVIIYPTQWATAGFYGDGATWADSTGFGHQATQLEADAIKGLIAQWKAAHSRVRCVIWTSDAALFDPENPSSLPDGNWGAWGTTGASRTPGRNRTTCRYWEPWIYDEDFPELLIR